MTEVTTKACSLTENEIHNLISHHCCTITESTVFEKLDRLNYLARRLKAFKEHETETKPAEAGWGT